MTEEFNKWLVRVHKVAEDMADDMSIVAYERGESGLQDIGMPDEFDGDEMISLHRQWQLEIGKRDETTL